MLYLHAGCFTLYLASGLLLYINYYHYFVSKEITYANKVVVIHTICNFLEFLAELVIAAIFFEKARRISS